MVDIRQYLNKGHPTNPWGYPTHEGDTYSALKGRIPNAGQPAPDSDFNSYMANMTGDERDAFAALYQMFDSYGLGSLAGDIASMVQNNMSPDSIALGLRETDAYKQRFAGNVARQKAGLPALDEKTYLSVESSYRQIMQTAGLPVGFYDQPDDFTNWIANDVSPTEVQQRVNVAHDLVSGIDSNVKSIFGEWYSHGDMVAYALDPTKTTALLQQQEQSAKAMGYSQTAGLNISRATAEQIGASGQLDSGGFYNPTLSDAQLQQGIGQAQMSSQDAKLLSSIYGTKVTDDDLVKSTLINDGASTAKVKRLASQERASFSGSGGAASVSFSGDAGRNV